MQHRRKKPLLLIGLVLLFAGALLGLMVHDIPAPQQAIEKPLDAKALLKQS